MLGPDLLPTTPTVTFTAASYGTNRLYFAEDTKPFFIGAAQIEWHIPQGEFYLAQADSLKFVRQQEDDDLAAQQANLVVPLAAERISNDGYYHNVTAVRRRAGLHSAGHERRGAAHDAGDPAGDRIPSALSLPEHAPVGGHVPVVGGVLTITNDLIDTAASYLSLAGSRSGALRARLPARRTVAQMPRRLVRRCCPSPRRRAIWAAANSALRPTADCWRTARFRPRI